MANAQKEGRPISGNSDLLLKSSELRKLSLKAMQGNGDAALRVARHYTFGMQDEIMGNYWFIIGAENGDAKSQWNISYALNSPPLSNDITTRGIFWIRKAAENGIQYAINELERLDASSYELLPDDDSDVIGFFSVSTENELERCKEGALQGNREAALVLVKHYNTINKSECVEYWSRIGAQNDDIECQYLYGQILSAKEDELEQERGRFWMHRATQNGYNP
jgi:hypothetical protein